MIKLKKILLICILLLLIGCKQETRDSFLFHRNGSLEFKDDADEYNRSINSILRLKINTWEKIWVIYNNTNIKFYFNGVLSGNWSDGPPVFINDVASNLEFSNSQGWGEFGGITDEVCYYNREPSAAEIKTRYDFTK